MTEQIDLDAIEARHRIARDAMSEDWQDNNAIIDAVSGSMYDVPPLVAEVRALRTLLTHPAAAELLDHHRYRRSGVHGSCSCRGDYGPGHETPEQWIAHLLEAGRLEHGIGGGT